MRRLRPFEAQYNAFRGIARWSKHDVSLSYEDFLEFTKIPECHYCGTEIPWRPFIAGKSSAYYLDRKENDDGYSVKNCVVCCTRCNWSKGSRFTYEEWVEIGKTIKLYRERK